MVGLARRRETVTAVRSACRDVSERRACKVLRQPRSTQRYRRKASDGEQALVARLRELARRHPRYGYRRMWALLRADWLAGEPQACASFATVPLRHRRTKGNGSRAARLAMVFKLCESAARRWRTLNGAKLLPDIIAGVQFQDGERTEKAAA